MRKRSLTLRAVTCVLFYKSSSFFPKDKDPRIAKKWIRNSFTFKTGETILPVRQEYQLLDNANDGSLESIFCTTYLDEDLARRALKTLPPFPTSYSYESEFFVMTVSKTAITKTVLHTRREGRIAGVIEFHNSLVGASRCGKTMSRFSLNQSCNNLYEL